MPPTFEAKMGKKDWGPTKLDLDGKLRALGLTPTDDIRQKIGELTYGECDDLAADLDRVADYQTAYTTLTSHWDRCTLKTKISQEEETWGDRCRAEARFNR